MTNSVDKIPLKVDIDRVIDVLAAQIYQSPLALLRENTQNAFDAILLRKADDPSFEPKIDVTIEPQKIVITDNGIGMTRDDIEGHFWKAGSSSKNNDRAKAAGVVGTFGIGAMANFGVSKELIVETEALEGSCRIVSRAERESLSASEDCISIEEKRAVGEAGTTVTAILKEGNRFNVGDAVNYLQECVSNTDIPVYANGNLISKQPIEEIVPILKSAWEERECAADLGNGYMADICVVGDGAGAVRVELSALKHGIQELKGKMVLSQQMNVVKAYRSGFSLAPTALSTVYGFGGVADFLFLQPTAGREALETRSLQVLQGVVTGVESYVSHKIAQHPQVDNNTAFMSWVLKHGKYDLCGKLTIRKEPDLGDITLESVNVSSDGVALNYYEGQDNKIIEKYSSEDSPLLVAATSNPRRNCQIGYIKRYRKNLIPVEDSPSVVKIKEESDFSIFEMSLVLRLKLILKDDYFVQSKVKIASLSHGLPVYVESDGSEPTIYINPEGSSMVTLGEVHREEYDVFDSMAKDFVRGIIFPKIADLVPSSTREGAEAFLKKLRSKRELFEYEEEDLGSLSEIWARVNAGDLTSEEGARRSKLIAARSVEVVDSGSAKSVQDVVPDVVNKQQFIKTGAEPGQAISAISRTGIETDAKLLTILDSRQAINGFQCFLALSDRIREQHGEFFLQPHTTSVIWGGQRILLIFQHHSGRFGLYYDIQLPDVIVDASGGHPYPTTTIVLKNRTFVPIPVDIQEYLLPPENAKKRLEVKCDIVYINP